MKTTFVCGNNGCFDKTRFEKNTLLRKHFTRRRASSSKRCTINKCRIRIVMRAARPQLMEFHGRAKGRWNWESNKCRSVFFCVGTFCKLVANICVLGNLSDYFACAECVHYLHYLHYLRCIRCLPYMQACKMYALCTLYAVLPSIINIIAFP